MLCEMEFARSSHFVVSTPLTCTAGRVPARLFLASGDSTDLTTRAASARAPLPLATRCFAAALFFASLLLGALSPPLIESSHVLKWTPAAFRQPLAGASSSQP